MTQQTETKVSRAYDGGIIILGALLLIAVIVGAVWLLSVAINDAPVVSAIFGILFVLFCVGSVIGYAAQTRWAITQNANVHIQVANSLGQALAQYKSQAPQIAAPQAGQAGKIDGIPHWLRRFLPSIDFCRRPHDLGTLAAFV